MPGPEPVTCNCLNTTSDSKDVFLSLRKKLLILSSIRHE